MTQTISDVIRELRDTVESPLSSRDDIRKVVTRLESVPLFRRAIKQDPMLELLDSVLMEVVPDNQGIATLAGQTLTVKLLLEAMGNNYADHGSTTRIGKRMSALGYKRVSPTRSLPARWRVPREIG